jgi:hypothetical protein
MSEIKPGDRVKVEYEGTVVSVENFARSDGRRLVHVKREDGRDVAISRQFVTVIEPAYEHGEFYRDAHNETFCYSIANGDQPWLKIEASRPSTSHKFDYPLRPLRKLVPEDA